jgi:trk system potassium uptake protein TrkA
MQVAVLGLGDFGLAVATQLVQNRVSVLVVDQDRERVELHRDKFDHAMIANFTNPTALREIGVKDMDAVVLTTSEPMETSILAVLRLKELGVKKLLAKAENDDHARVLQALGVNDIILPEHDAALRIANSLSWPNVAGLMQILPGYSIMEFDTPPFLVNKRVREARLREDFGIAIIAVCERTPSRVEVNPDPDRVLTRTCSLLLLGSDAALERLRKQTG